MARKSAGKSLGTELETLLGHRFARPELLTLALTHRSFVFDAGLTLTAGADPANPSQDNEQLEFVGDAALGLLAAEALFRRFPNQREGELTRLRASVISRKHLGEVGTRLALGQWLRLGHTAERNAGRDNPALLANVVEALIAAIYLDGGLDAARAFVEREVLANALPETAPTLAPGEQFSSTVGDHKSALQEMLQAQGRRKPEYRLVEESGPDHKRLFRVEVWLEGDSAVSEAAGTTKKQAQQLAAQLAVSKLLAQQGSAA